jgi:hypothetical protein
MHPIWFMQWVWQKAWSQGGLAPLLEHNQGSLSLAALTLALIILKVENDRAKKAEAKAAASERLQVEAARAAEAERRQYELETQRGQAELAREAEIDRQLLHMARFVKAANGILIRVGNALVDDINAAGASKAEDGTALYPSPGTRKTAVAAAHSLIAIIPASPMEPDLIVDVRRIALDVEWLGSETFGYYQGAAAAPHLRQQADKLVSAREQLSEYNIALLAQLRPSLSRDLQPIRVDAVWPAIDGDPFVAEALDPSTVS